VVIYAALDREPASRLVRHLQRRGVAAWWAEEDITQGQWEAEVLSQIEQSDALVPLVSSNTRLHQIFTDEWSHAEACGKAIFPIVLDRTALPLGKRGYSHTHAPDYSDQQQAFEAVAAKLLKNFEAASRSRQREVLVGSKRLALPNFVFSLSSFETQLHPLDGLQLLASLPGAPSLVSAFDVHSSLSTYRSMLRPILDSSERVVLLDSGNYEATRKNAYASSNNKAGWTAARFWEVAASLPWDLIFSFDHPVIGGSAGEIAEGVLDSYFRDMLRTGISHTVLCPIVHAPTRGGAPERHRADTAAALLKVCAEIRPTLVAIPERELGDGLLERMKTVKAIRAALDTLPWYQLLHILGTGNPTTIAALAVCGADTFDGLEWCRTAANFENNNLMHFQQFDLLKNVFVGRMTHEVARTIVEGSMYPFALRAASYNFDYFTGWLRLVNRSAHSGNPEAIFQGIPLIGNELVREYLSGT
jgi:hypothetical protein